MYLKSIEIHGFKSFANRIVFQFHNGITDIVGPNGSGKSNVADAVRWVLGEQRVKQLRGSSMQDVIFAGTETRKPMGFAYVAITLDNSDHQLPVDYTEVTVARRLYRSGESEYLLNGTACRLKDIAEMFYDTGIGKEGYSIIGQGQIDRILSDRPEDRRELFDEAAGIVKFKRRKEAAEKKLTDEQENLVRVRDILGELEARKDPLGEQASKAQSYLRIREEQKRYEVNVFLLENETVRAQLAEAETSLETAGRDLAQSREDFDSVRAQHEQLSARLLELEREMDAAREEITRNNAIRGQLEGDIKVYREQIRAARSNLEHFSQRLDTVTQELERIQGERDKSSRERAEVQEKVNALEAERDKVQAELTKLSEKIRGDETAMEEARAGILHVMEERAKVRSRLSGIEASLEQLGIRKAQLTSRLVQAQSDESRQEEIIKACEEAFQKVSDEIEAIRAEHSQREKELGGMRERLADQDRILREAEQSFHQDNSKLEALRNLTERYEGFGGSVKRVMEMRTKEPGLLGVVADLIKTEEGYETAIEIALGGNIQNIVTEDEPTAKRMIEVLKREKAGRATFLPLTSLEHPQQLKEKEVLKEPGVLGLASDLVRTEARFKTVAQSLLGRIIVVESFDKAQAIGRKYHHTIRMVTLEGELFVPGGAISGGTFRNNSNLLGRRRELAELEERVKAHRKAREDAQQEIENIKSRRNELRGLLAESDTLLQSALIRQNTARLDLVREREKKDEAAGSYEQLRDEDARIREDDAALTAEKAENEEKLGEFAREETRLNGLIEERSKGLSGLRDEEQELVKAVNGWEVQIGEQRQGLAFRQQDLDRIQVDYARVLAEQEEIKESIRENEETGAEREKRIQELEKTLLAGTEQKGASEEKLSALTEERELAQARQKELLDRREQLSEQIGGLDKEQFRLTALRDRLRDSLETQINYLFDEYEITPGDAVALRDETLTELPKMKREAAKIRQQIKALGPVNVGAIDEYAQLMERYNLMSTQYEDLVKAAEVLRGIIAELDSSMRKQFKQQFERIATEFNVVFRELFGGGSASLELMEDEDILVAGVRVVAQPPGKKLQNMMQMSGGEKALTAISLLFAIQNLKPSPFCLLDEIEAALDESNVGRFASYLHKLSKNTQFIVITHRRGTMEKADRLYGITMQEKGVSALVSVNLIDAQLDD